MDVTQTFTNCPQCGKRCPLDAPSCERGRELAAKLKSGEPVDMDAIRKEHSGRKRGRHRRDRFEIRPVQKTGE